MLPHKVAAQDSEASREGGYEFVNPLLACGVNENQPSDKLSELQKILESEVSALKKSGSVSRISVYFRDMNYGNWTGVNQDDTFIPASLMKVPLYVAYLRQAQQNPALLTQKYILPATPDDNANETFKPVHPLVPGEYTVQELLNAMIIGSDNNAARVLNTHVATTTFNDVYGATNLPPGGEDDKVMSPKDYMAIFRVLYNATYLWRGRSQTALDTLSKTEFTPGLVAGVGSTTVAHKFGERSVYLKDLATGQLTLSQRELHDCGVIYYPGSPYGLCIMTEGTDFTAMAGAIADISRVVYDQVQKGILTQH